MKKTIRVIPVYKDSKSKKISIALLQKSSESKDPNSWEFPGGKLDSGTTWKETAINELREETGIYADISDLEKIGSDSYLNTATNKKTSVTFYILWLDQKSQIKIGQTLNKQGLPEDNHQAGEWLTLKEFKQFKIANNTQLLWNKKRLRRKLHENIKAHKNLDRLNITS